MRHVVIGCGGIGGWLIRALAPQLSADDELALIDGDSFEPRNLARQGATSGSKAEHYRYIASAYRCRVHAFQAYVTKAGRDGTMPVDQIVGEGSTVWACVDNHATRKVIIDRCRVLADVQLISGGCDGWEGNVIKYTKADGEDLAPNPYKRHPELAKRATFRPPEAQDRAQACQAQADDGSGQTIAANMQAASCMLMAWQAEVSEIYFCCQPPGLRVVKV